MKATTTARTVGFALENFDGRGSSQILSYIEPELSFAGTEINALGELAALGATTTAEADNDNFTSRFFSSLLTRITAWFADAQNGIGDFFARVGNFGRVNTDELCVDDVCVTRDEFLRMKDSQSAAGASDLGGAEAPSGSSAEEANPDTDTATDTATAAATSTQSVSAPANDNEPAVDNADEAPAEPEPVLEASNDDQPADDLATVVNQQ